MNCMKCGREVPMGHAFCKDCLADMASYPVKPGAQVVIPRQPTESPARRSQSTRKTKKPEEQVKNLRKLVLWLVLALIAVLLAFAITVSALVHRINEEKENTKPGENYLTSDQAST